MRARDVGARLVLLAGLSTLGCKSEGIVRTISGNEVVGRRIDARAYAEYAAGADAEARGDDARALSAFEAAAREDSASPEIWTRLGALRCRRGDPTAVAAFERARSLEDDFQPLHHELAACALRDSRLPAALIAAERAVGLDPARVESAALFAVILERSGRVDEARRALVALTVRAPTSADAWTALRDFSERIKDEATRRRAVRALAQLEDRASRARALATVSDVDELLAFGDDDRAKRDARSARLSSAELALRAAAFGRVQLARAQAELVLGADPGDLSAQIALAVAADLQRDDAALAKAISLVLMRPAASATTPLARALFAELLLRRSGESAARAFLAASPEPDAKDPLAQRIALRAKARVAKSTPN